MARFEAYTLPVDLRQNFFNPLFDLKLLHRGATSITESPHEIVVTGYNYYWHEFVELDLFSAPHHPFTFSHHIVTGGVISQIRDDWGKTSSTTSPYYAIFCHASAVALRTDVREMFTNPDKSLLDTWHLLLPGNNLITGSAGSDFLVGSNGSNTFRYDLLQAPDVIINFKLAGVDKISFKNTLFDSFLEVRQHSTFVDHHLVITLAPHDTITVDTIHNLAQLYPSEFLFHN